MADVEVDPELLAVGVVVGVLLAAAGTRWVEDTVDGVLNPFGGLF